MQFSARTDVGRVRKENQDSYGISTHKNFYFVCDGMGGGAAGDFASRAAVEIVLRSLETLADRDTVAVAGGSVPPINEEFLVPAAAIRLANRGLVNLTDRYPKLAGMGTTIVGVMFDQRRETLHIYHVGDSRVYRLRAGVLELITKDHSKVNELIDQGKMREDEVKTAEIQSMITRALGTHETVKVDYRAERVLPDDVFMLCSDGLNGEIEDTAIRQIMVANVNNVENAARALIDAANNAGGRDNTTVIVLRALREENDEQLPVDRRPGQVITVTEETPEQTVAEDRILKAIMSSLRIHVPKDARDKVFLNNPLYLGIALTLLVVGMAVALPRCSTKHKETELLDLAGKITGMTVDVRVPIEEQAHLYASSDDSVQKLQIIQDWQRKKTTLTQPLTDVEVVIEKDGKEKYRGLSGGTPVEIKLEKGQYTVRASYKNYRILGETLQLKDSITVNVEPAESYRSIDIIMIPQK